MIKFNTLAIAIAVIFGLVLIGSNPVMAQTITISDGPLTEENLEDNPEGAGQSGDIHDVATWITKWYGPDGNYTENGGFGTSGPIDLMSEGTGGKITDVSLSTIDGLLMTQDVDVEWGDDHGGTRGWTVYEIDPASGDNMNRGGPADNYDLYGVLVIDSPEDMTSTMSPAHDDYAQIWINGEKWYNNSLWTGAANKVQFNIEVSLKKGANVLVYRCGEGVGSGYFNLHFDDATHNAATIYPKDATDKASFFDEIAPITAVEAAGKLTTTWADIKRK